MALTEISKKRLLPRRFTANNENDSSRSSHSTRASYREDDIFSQLLSCIYTACFDVVCALLDRRLVLIILLSFVFVSSGHRDAFTAGEPAVAIAVQQPDLFSHNITINTLPKQFFPFLKKIFLSKLS